MNAVEILTAARDLISEPERWTQGTYARDVHGEPTSPLVDSAVCFCAYGAIHRAGGLAVLESLPAGAELALMKALSGVRKPYVAHFNDAPERTHAEVIAMFDRAIEIARGAA